MILHDFVAYDVCVAQALMSGKKVASSMGWTSINNQIYKLVIIVNVGWVLIHTFVHRTMVREF